MTLLTADDLYLFNEGRHYRLYERLGVHRPTDAVATSSRYGRRTRRRSRSIGDRNGWNVGRARARPVGSSGVWSGSVRRLAGRRPLQVPDRRAAAGYRVDKADPFAFATEAVGRHRVGHRRPCTTTGTTTSWIAGRGPRQRIDAPVSIYEVHLGSWRRGPDGFTLPYREVAPQLARYAVDRGFTHVELMPIMEHPFFGSWGYQTTSYFAPTARFGSPTDFMEFVDVLHEHGLGVILDWVPSHFPSDEFGLARFDGTHLYEHSDPRQGRQPDWGTLIFNYARHEVRSFLISSACFWLDRYHADALRVDAVASMLYLDYSRRTGRVGAERVRRPREPRARCRSCASSTKRSTGRSPTYRPTPRSRPRGPECRARRTPNGLGFGAKWDMGWMHDTLEYFRDDPIHRQLPSRRADLPSRVRVDRELRAAALARRGRARQGRRSRRRCRATRGRSSRICGCCTATSGRCPARSCCSWAASSRSGASGTTTGRSTGSSSERRRARRRPALGRRPQPGAARAARRSTSSTPIRPGSAGRSPTTAPTARWPSCATTHDGRHCLFVGNFTPVVRRDARIPVPARWLLARDPQQ